MNKNEKFQMNEFIKPASTALYSLIPILIGISFIFYSLSQYPDYSMIEFYVSQLGTGPKPSAQFFNVGVIIIGAASVHFFIHLGKLLKANGIDEIIRKIAVRISIFGGISLSLIGCFPMFGTLLIMHNIVSSSFFLSGMIYFILFSYLMIKSQNFSKYQSILGFLVAGVFGTYLFTGHPAIEWSVVFSAFAWVILNAGWLAFKNLKIFLITKI
ncbi:MAG: DUF998 domain-containing protein [Promethearchaeati archaeon]